MDIFTREGVAIEVGQSLKGDDVVQTLNRSKSKRGVPKLLFCDNGSEFSSQVSSCTQPVDNRSCVFNDLLVALNLWTLH